jgi:iron complex transport system permease protein
MNTKRRDVALFGGSLLLLCLSLFLSIRFGNTYLTNDAFFGGMFDKEHYKSAAVIIRAIRLPRMLAGAFAGAGLALSGTLLQRATDNPLAAPNIIGINAGAGFFVMLSLALFPSAFALLPFAAFVGAMLTAAGILALSHKVGLDKSTVVLCGVAFSALFGAGVSFFSAVAGFSAGT